MRNKAALIVLILIILIAGCGEKTRNGPESGPPDRKVPSMGDLEPVCRKILGKNRGAILVFELSSGAPLAVINPDEAFGRAVRPGSVFKLITAGALLEYGKIDSMEKISCNNFFKKQGRSYICSEPGGHGPVDLTQALARSCSIYFYKAGSRLEKSQIESFAHKMGCGRSFLVVGRKDRPVAGICRAPEDPRDFLDYLVGDSDGIKITPYQAANITAVIATGRSLSPDISAPPMKESVRRILKQAMERSAVEGTASIIGKMGIDGGAKTGTSSNTTLKGKTHGWFCGFYPAGEPRYAVVVFLDDGKGYIDAAPMGAEIFKLLKDIEAVGGGRK